MLRFSEERDPAVPARFVRLRVTDPEGAYWRRGFEAAGRWLRETGQTVLHETGSTVLRVPCTLVTHEDWGGVGGYPLAQWIVGQRRDLHGRDTGGRAGDRAGKARDGVVRTGAAWADGIAVANRILTSRLGVGESALHRI
ncbi:hypothetical protein [Streptomyces atratus]|uniref:hypothetical protein n=1 Tax=Streptomyces atratus TaxID=1893 RepID=UPI0021A34BE6|nr:hypothetical protein [Streptomyces atratus]MCT2548196.1 hypothetical protein [Streptomyces atratus]